MIAILFPHINNIAIRIWNFDIYWYSLSYIAGFIFGYLLISHLDKENRHFLTKKSADDLLFFSVIFVILGGRLGYCFFYEFSRIIDDPLRIFAIRNGGMSFHGGLIGMILALFWVSKREQIAFLALTDLISCVAPIGIFFGRLANFVNGELYGRTTNVSWGVIFPHGGDLPRHPSQLYEACSEGLILFAIMMLLFSKFKKKPDGFLSGAFITTYGTFRFICEYFREPDVQLGFFLDAVTMGQILSIPMIALGIYFMWKKWKSVS